MSYEDMKRTTKMSRGRTMAATEEQAPPTERERVMGWRCLQLVEAGMAYDDAWRLAHRANWRDALDLIEKKGCPPDLAFDIAR